MAKQHISKFLLYSLIGVLVVTATVFLIISLKNSDLQNKNYCSGNYNHEIVQIISNLPEVNDFIINLEKENKEAIVEVSSIADDEITIHAYEIVTDQENGVGHTATFDWYYLNCQGEVIGSMSKSYK